jgi:hypothetical protein
MPAAHVGVVPEQAWQAAPPTPHDDELCPGRSTQLFPLQQPVGQLIGLHTHIPFEHV